MKKIILVLFALLTIFLVYKKVGAEEVVIPDTSIRLRVIPNSNSNYDQAIKSVVKKYLEKDVYNLFKDTNNIEEARVIIDNYIAMLHGNEYDEELLEEANAFVNTGKQANRIKCATLSWNGLKDILDK